MTGKPAGTHTAVTAMALACALTMLWSVNAPAQTIAGTVRSGHDPIVGATVRVLELDRSLRSGARGQRGHRHQGTGIAAGTWLDYLYLSTSSDL